MIDQLFDDDQKSKLCLEYIEAFFGCRGLLIVGYLENSGQAAANHMGQIFAMI